MGKQTYNVDDALAVGVFGKLKVEKHTTKDRVRCLCQCGGSRTIPAGRLLSGGVTCCGCSYGGITTKNAKQVGTFGELTVIGGGGKGKLLCECSCGGNIIATPEELFHKVKTSCRSCKDTRTRAMRYVDDLIECGYRKDMLVAYTRDDERTTRGQAYILFKCDCGNIKSFAKGGVEALEFGSCGCYKPKVLAPSPASVKALKIGRFGKLTTVAWAGDDSRYVNCVCDCGNKKRIRSDSLLTGDTQSCGCLAREEASKRLKGKFKSNAYSRHPLHSTFSSMQSRCKNPNADDYPHYGGRGIKICDRWNTAISGYEAFANFVNDMERDYEKGLEIERLDVNGNYEKENCTWITRRSQVNNLRRNKVLSGWGISLNVSEWGELLQFNRHLLDDRINHLKWDEDLEHVLSITFKDRRYSLLFEGQDRSASEIFKMLGYTLGQRNRLITKHGGSVEALHAIGADIQVLKEREKDYLSFQEGLDRLRNLDKDRFEDHLLYKIEKQLEDS